MKTPEGQRDLYLASFYHPHTENEQSMEELGKSLARASKIPNAQLIIGGDFNLPGYTFPDMTLKPDTPYKNVHIQFADYLADNGLAQMVTEPTRGPNTLDYMVTNIPSRFVKTLVIPGLSDHNIPMAEVNLNPLTNKETPRRITLYKKANWDQMRSDMKTTLNNVVTVSQNGGTADDMWNCFKNDLKQSITENIPQATAKAKRNLPWLSPEVKKLIRKRDRLYKRMKKSGDSNTKSKFKEIKKQVQKGLRRSYWTHIEEILSPQDQTSGEYHGLKRFWTYIKYKKNDHVKIGPLRHDGVLNDDPKRKAELLNQQFQSAFSQKDDTRNLPEVMLPRDISPAEDVVITENGILKLLLNLKTNKAPGPDDVRPIVLKSLAPEIAPILTFIFQVSLDTGVVPSDWKKANVTPVFKKGDRNKAENYRPISLTCICCKLLEHVITSHIMNHAEANNILYPLQHGFRRGRSCETQLVDFVDDLSKNMSQRLQTDVLIMDFSKAFDKVHHGLLLHKLHQYGVQGNVHRWIGSFLQGRTQRVLVEGEKSQEVEVESGVPQGSVLGPSLFLYFINDMPQDINATVRLFADDTIAYLAVKSNKDSKRLQEDLDRLAAWEETWRMRFHPDKCVVLPVSRKDSIIDPTYFLHGQQLAVVRDAKYLGCVLTHDLRWRKHIDQICSKANRTLGFLRRNLSVNSQHLKTQAYTSLVRPLVEYASPVWDPYTKETIDQVEKVQRRASRYVTNRHDWRTSTSELTESLRWQSLVQRRQDARLTLIYKIANGLVHMEKDSRLIPPRRMSRHTHEHSFQIPPTGQDYRKYSFFPRTIVDWNCLPCDITAAPSLEAFKASLSALRWSERLN